MAEIIKLRKPIKVDGREIRELDLSALEDLTGRDILQINRLMEKKNKTPSQASMVLPESDPETLMYCVAAALQLPVECLMELPANDFMAVKRAASAFFLADSDGDEDSAGDVPADETGKSPPQLPPVRDDSAV